MSASGRVLDDVRRTRRPMRFLGASGQLGYGIPTPAFNAGLARKPDLIGCDMGSIDIGPTYLGKGEMATAPAATRRDLRKVLLGARSIDVPLVIGSAGSAGAAPHLDATLAIVREIARAEGLHFRLGVLRADLSRDMLRGVGARRRGGRHRRHAGADRGRGDRGRAYRRPDGHGSVPPRAGRGHRRADRRARLRYRDLRVAADDAGLSRPGLSVHMAKIIECASLCCLPGGRDSILATLDDDGFELESMAEQRRATPVSVAAHSLYEQADPFTVYEPEGRLDLSGANYAAVDDRRCRVTGAAWHESTDPCVKIEGARKIGERAVLLAGAADPRFIAQHREILPAVATVVRDLVCEDAPEDYTLRFRVYGVDGVRMAAPAGEPPPGEVFVMGECIAPTAERAAEVVRTLKQYLLHHGYAGGCPPRATWRFRSRRPRFRWGRRIGSTCTTCCETHDPDALFPLEVETL